jgi:hypothetical protein
MYGYTTDNTGIFKGDFDMALFTFLNNINVKETSSWLIGERCQH